MKYIIHLVEIARYKNYQNRMSQDTFNYVKNIYPPFDVWLLDNYVKNDKFVGDEADLKKTLSLYDSIRKKQNFPQDQKNISGKSIEDIESIIQNYRGQTQVKSSKGIEVVYQDDEWLILIPKTKAMSIKYGRGTKWCTTSTEGKNYFNQYTNVVGITLYYLINKKYRRKFASAVYPDGNVENFDEQNKTIDLSKNEKILKTVPKELQEKLKIFAKWNGEYIRYYNNGQLWVKCTYVNGKYDGEYISYYQNGQIWIKCTYVNGEYDGEYIYYYDNGLIKVKCTYVNDKKDGEYIKYYFNGQIWKHYIYDDGEVIKDLLEEE